MGQNLFLGDGRCHCHGDGDGDLSSRAYFSPWWPVFSFYSAFVGYRVLGQKAAYKGEKTAHNAGLVCRRLYILSSAVLALLGAKAGARAKPRHSGNGLRLHRHVDRGPATWAFTHRPKEKMFWWYAHLAGMLGSYIAAWTAFSVVTIGPLLHGAWWIWVVPTAIGVPSIAMTTGLLPQKIHAEAEEHRAQAVA